jgi:hypothetical protein
MAYEYFCSAVREWCSCKICLHLILRPYDTVLPAAYLIDLEYLNSLSDFKASFIPGISMFQNVFQHFVLSQTLLGVRNRTSLSLQVLKFLECQQDLLN